MKEPFSKPVVTFYHRKPREVGNYSLEFIFSDVRDRLAGFIDSRVSFSRYESSGLFRRLYNCLEAAFRQSEVNHITGDVNYLGLFLEKRKTIQTIHDCVHLATSSGLRHRLLKYFWLTMPIKRATYITANSESTKREILKYSSCPPDKIKVIYVAISEKFQKSPRVFNATKPRILQIGTAPNKNIPRLIEALEGIPCTLEIVGKHVPEYEKMLEAKNIEYEYRWGLDPAEVIRSYEAADIISLASVYEGFGMPILEGQAVGRPVITSNVYSMPEVAAKAACLVDPFDPLSIRKGVLRIIQDESYREQLVAGGFENVKRFNPDRIAAQYLDLYINIIHKR